MDICCVLDINKKQQLLSMLDNDTRQPRILFVKCDW